LTSAVVAMRVSTSGTSRSRKPAANDQTASFAQSAAVAGVEYFAKSAIERTRHDPFGASAGHENVGRIEPLKKLPMRMAKSTAAMTMPMTGESSSDLPLERRSSHLSCARRGR